MTATHRPRALALPLAALLALSILAPPAALAVPSGCTVGIERLHWKDADGDGHLDAVTIDTNVAVEKSTVYPDDFNFGTAQAPRRGLSLGTPTTGTATSFTIGFPEGPLLDAGPTTGTGTFQPALSYDGVPDGKVHVRAAGGNPDSPTGAPAASCFSQGSGITNLDEAAPVLLAAYATSGASTVTAVFSEPVSFSSTDPNAHFCFIDSAASAGTGERSFTGTLATGASQAVSLDLGTYVLTAHDVDVGRFAPGTGVVLGADVPARLYAQAGGACGGGAASHSDTAATPNAGANPTAFDARWTTDAHGTPSQADISGAVPVGAPIPVAVHGAAGDRTVFVEFSGPVTSTGGGALSSGFSVSPSAGSADWAVAGVSHQAGGLGGNVVRLSTIANLPADPDDLFVQPGAVLGQGSSAQSPSSAWDTSPLDGPTIVRVLTQDADLNGCVDAVKITFNAPIADSSVTGTWGVHWPGDPAGTGLAFSTGGTGGFDIDATLLPPASGADDATAFLAFTGAPNRPGDAQCHGTGAADGNGFSALPRISYDDGSGRALHRMTSNDGAAPAIVSIATRDCMVPTCTPNGKIDGVEVTFSEPVADAAFRAADWRVEVPAGSPCTTSGTSPGLFAVSGTHTLGTANDAVHGLVLAEGAVPDTGCIPDVTYTGTAVADAAGKALPAVQRGPSMRAIAAATFGAGTVTLSAGAMAVVNQVNLAQARGVADATAGAGATTLTSAANGFQGDDVGRVVTGAGVALDTVVTAVAAGGGSATINRPTTGPVAPGTGGVALRWFDFLAAGVAVGSAVQVAAASTPSAVGNYTVSAVTASTFSYAGPNPGSRVTFAFARQASEVDHAGPVLLQAIGTVGSTAAQAVFSERPCGGSGGPTSSCPDLQAAAFQYVDAAAGGASAVSSAARSATDAHKADLGLSAPLASADVSGNDCLRLVPPSQPGRPGTGVALTDAGPSFSWSTPSTGFNVPYPAQADPCVAWATSGGLRVRFATTVDANADGYLDAIRVEVETTAGADAPIRDGTRLLRHDGSGACAAPSTTADGLAGCGDTVYFDMDMDGAASSGDRRLTAFGATAPGTLDCAAPGVDADCGTALSAQFSVLWADGDLNGPGASDAASTDGLYADRDSSNTVSSGDFRYWDAGAGALAAGTQASCPAAPATGDIDCGRALTPTSFNLQAPRFTLGEIASHHVQPVVQCVTTGKDAGPVLGGPFSSCGGVVGDPAPPGGAAPTPVDSCAGALPSLANDNVFFVCFTPWMMPATAPTPPSVPIPNTGYLPRLAYAPTGPTSVIRAASGSATLGGFDMATADGARPALVRAAVEGGSRSARLTFSEPVGGAAGGVGGSTVTPSNLAYINGNAGTAYCRSGVDAIASVATLPATTSAGTGLGLAQYNVTVNFQGNLSHEDVVGCVQNPPPASATPSRDAVRATPSLLERGSSRAADATRAVPFIDRDRPRMEGASFIDANGDGTIDAVRLAFSEPVNDCFGPVGPDTDLRPPATFPDGPVNCFGSANPTAPDPTREYRWGARIGDFEVKADGRALAILHIVTGQTGTVPTPPATSAEPCRAHYSTASKPAGVPDGVWTAPLALANDAASATGAPDGFNDNVVFLCLDPDSVSTGPGRGTQDLGTGRTGNVTYTADADLSCESMVVGLRPVCDVADVGPDPAWTSTANPLATSSRTVADAARPVVLSAAADDRDHNGKVDAVKVTFSERVKPSTFSRADWSVEGHPITGIDTAGNAGATCPASTSTTAGLDRFWLCFAEAPGASTFDTDLGHAAGSGPRVTYVGGGGLSDLVAGAGANRLRAFDAAASDGAQPVVVRLQSTVGSATATVTFSEPVDGTGGPDSLSITYNDLYYENGGTGGSVTGFGSSQVVHSPGDRAAALTLNAPAAQTDIDNDKVCFVANAVREHGPAPVLSLFDTCFRLNGVAGDRQPPGAVGDLRLDRDNSTATTLSLAWTAPNDADLGAYTMYGCTCRFNSTMTASNIGAFFAPVGTPPTPARGAVQKMTVPAQPFVQNFTLLVRDQAGNGILSNAVTVPPLDAARPDPVTAITVVSEQSELGDRVTLSWTAGRDDAGVATSGRVDRYSIHRTTGPGPITAATAANRVAASAMTPDVTGTGAAANVVAPGQTQSVTLTGLAAGTQYTVVVIPVDEQGNEATLQGSAQKTFTPTALGGASPPETIPSLTAGAGTPPASSVLLSWPTPRAPANAGGVPTGYRVYYSTLDLNERANQDLKTEAAAADLEFLPARPAAPGTAQQATVRGLDENTTYYFMVVAADGAGRLGALGGVASQRTAADPTAISAATVRLRNLAIDVTVAPVANGTGNLVTWTLPEEDPLHPTRGVQVWRCTGGDSSTCTLLATLDAASAGFRDRAYTDAGGNATHRYAVTSYYGSSPAKGYARSSAEAAMVPGFTEISPQGAGGQGVPLWLWIAVGAVAIVILVAGLAWMARSRRAPPPPPVVEGEPMGEGAWPAEGAAAGAAAPGTEAAVPAGPGAPAAPPAPSAAAGGPPKHYVTCPKCSTQFSAIGAKPLAIQCPNCGVKGMLK